MFNIYRVAGNNGDVLILVGDAPTLKDAVKLFADMTGQDVEPDWAIEEGFGYFGNDEEYGIFREPKTTMAKMPGWDGYQGEEKVCYDPCGCGCEKCRATNCEDNTCSGYPY